MTVMPFGSQDFKRYFTEAPPYGDDFSVIISGVSQPPGFWETELTVTTYGPGCVLGVSGHRKGKGFPFLKTVKLSCSVQPGVCGAH